MHTLIVLLCIALFLTALGDYASTQLALSAPGVREANPVNGWFQRVLGPAWIIPRLLMALAIIAAVLTSAPADWRGAAIAGLAVALTSYAIWSNLRLWRANRINSV